MKQYLTPSLILLSAILLVVIVQWSVPKPIDWTENYYAKDARPYGCQLLVERLPDLFPGQKIQTPSLSLYKRKNTVRPGNYLFINGEFFLSDADLNILLKLVHEGSHAFIAAAQLSSALEDTLHIKSTYAFSVDASVPVNFTQASRRAAKPYQYKHIEYLYALTHDSVTTPVQLSTVSVVNTKIKSDSATNFIAVPWGKGYFFIHTLPQAFSNYNIVDPVNAGYIAKALSYLPAAEVFWEEYYTDVTYASTHVSDEEGNEATQWNEGKAYPIRKNDELHENDSPFRFLLSEPPLRWALYLALAGLVLFVFFEAKRRQRIVPVISPLSNASLEFTETVGRLYYQHRDHKNIAEKKITYLLEVIRNRYYVNTNKIDEEFYETLARKSGINRDEIESLFRFIGYIQKQGAITEEQLLDLNRRIQRFSHV